MKQLLTFLRKLVLQSHWQKLIVQFIDHFAKSMMLKDILLCIISAKGINSLQNIVQVDLHKQLLDGQMRNYPLQKNKLKLNFKLKANCLNSQLIPSRLLKINSTFYSLNSSLLGAGIVKQWVQPGLNSLTKYLMTKVIKIII